MNLFRNLLFWIVLALVGALVAQLLVQDPGYVLVRYRGNDYSTTLAAALLIGLAALAARMAAVEGAERCRSWRCAAAARSPRARA